MDYPIKSNSWDSKSNRRMDEDAVVKLQYRFGEAATIVSTMQAGLEAVLDSFDTRQFGTPVVMSVACPEWVLNGVLRSGGIPAFMDMGTGHSTDPSMLAQALEDIGPCIVIHVGLYGEKIPNKFVELSKDCVSIGICLDLPRMSMTGCTFSIYDMAPSMNVGGCVSTEFFDLHKRFETALKRSGDYVSPYECMVADRLWAEEYRRSQDIKAVAQLYQDECDGFGIVPLIIIPEDVTRYYPIMVKNAEYTEAFLAGNYVDSKVMVRSLKDIPYVQSVTGREFPNTEMYKNKVIGLPTNINADLVPFIIELVNKIESRLG